MLFKNEERMEEQDKIIRALEHTLKEKEKTSELSGSKRVGDRSEISSSFFTVGDI